MLLATPVGWAAVAVTAVVEGTVIAITAIETGKLGKIAGDKAHELFDWTERNLPKWLN